MTGETYTTLTFQGAGWAGFLTALAAAALGWELFALLAEAFRRWRPVAATLVAVASLAAGPVLACVTIIQGVLRSRPDQPMPGRDVLPLAFRGTLVVGLAAAVFFLPMGAGSPGGAVMALGVCTGAWCIRAYRRTTSPIGRWTRIALLATRFAVVVLLAGILSRPVLNRHFMEEVRGAVLLAVDRSASMLRLDCPAEPDGDIQDPATERISRLGAVQRQFERVVPDLAALTSSADVEVVSFSAEPQPVAELPEVRANELLLPPAEGRSTAIGDSLQQAFDRMVRNARDVAAVVVISDGSNNTANRIAPEGFAALLAARNVPLHAVGVGSPEVTPATRTVSIKELTVQEEIEAFHRLPIAAQLEVFGLDGRFVKVSCHFGDKELGSEVIQAEGREFRKPLRWVHVPLRNGFHRVEVRAELLGERPRELGGEPEASQLVHVLDRELRLLYVEGKIRYEVKFIKNALLGAKRFTIDNRILLQPLAEGDVPPLSEELDDWLVYHAVILGDVGPSRFTDKQLEILRDLVGEYGKGFCMIGGTRSFGAGGWNATPLADVLPVDPARSIGQIDRAIRAVPTAAGATSELMRIDPNVGVRAAWAKLPPLPGANRLGGLKPAAEVLAETPDGTPLIVVQRYGKGRSLAIAFDTTYRWVLTPEKTAEMQKRFWRQVALFLCAPKGNVWIAADKPRYDLRALRNAGVSIEVTAGVEDAQGRPLLTTPAEVVLTGPEGKTTPLQLAGDVAQGRRVGRIPGKQIDTPGVYRLEITAEVRDKTLTADHSFEVTERDLEARDVLANHALLKRVAKAGRGVFAPLRRLRDILAAVQVQSRPRQRPRVESLDYAVRYRWPLLWALVALLCIEWSLRKRKGLV